MKKFILLLVLICTQFLPALEAQEFIHLDIVNNNSNSVNHLIDCDDVYCFIALYEYSDQYRSTSIVRMNHAGTELGRLSDISFNEFDIQFISQLNVTDDEIIVFANANISGDSKFITFSISKAFDSYTLIDQIDLGNKYLATEGFMFDMETNSYETFGITRSNNNSLLLDNFYLNVGSDGNINTFLEIDIYDDVSIITAFSRIDDEYNYITFDNSNSIILDSEFNIVSDGIQEYSFDLESSFNSFLVRSYFASAYDDKLVIVGTGANNTEYASAISIVDLSNDTIVLDTVMAIMDEGVSERILSVNAKLDKDNNLITSSVGYYDGSLAIDENTLYIDKFDSQLQEVWSLDITTEYELVSYQIHVSDNSTIYIGGSYRGVEQIGIRNNFLIIISNQGDIISSNLNIDVLDQVSVYPNPTSGELHIKGVSNPNAPYKLYNTNGVIVDDGKLNEISLRNISKGIYTLCFDGISKRIVLQ